jgi:hypothetical protein
MVVLKDLVVDLFFAFRPVVEWNGVVKGLYQTAVDQLLAVLYLLPKDVREGLKVEYLVVETLLTLALAPVPTHRTLVDFHGVSSHALAQLPAARNPFNAMYLNRMLLEMCKHNMSVCDPIAVGVEMLFQVSLAAFFCALGRS